MKIRLVSDLHLDINCRYPLDFHSCGLESMFTLVAGDISGSPEQAKKWVMHNIERGAFVSGNHDVYDTSMCIEDVKAMFASSFPASSDVTYFDYDVGVMSKDIGENIMLVADVMYTDYEFRAVHGIPPDMTVRSNIEIADPYRGRRGGMNDFNYGKCKKTWPGVNDRGNGNERRLVPEYYLEHHKNAFKKMTEIIESSTGKDIIVMTHHCLSPRCISSEYDHDIVNASYVSDKTGWVMAHPNIKCICSGHIHSHKSFKVGQALYVMNPLGYCNDTLRQWSSSEKKYVTWTPDCIIDTSTWTVSFNPHQIASWEDTYARMNADIMKNIGLFM